MQKGDEMGGERINRASQRILSHTQNLSCFKSCLYKSQFLLYPEKNNLKTKQLATLHVDNKTGGWCCFSKRWGRNAQNLQPQYCKHAWLGSNKGLIKFQARRKRLTRHPDAPAVIVRAALGGNVHINSVYQMDSWSTLNRLALGRLSRATCYE